MNFYPIKTNDETISLYNLDCKDVYHSKIGAYTEALHKYVVPSEILNVAKENNAVRILDVCFGLGYNSKVAVNEILKINPDANILITAVEIDPIVLAFSILIGNECYSETININFYKEISRRLNIKEILNNYIEKTAKLLPQIKGLIPSDYELVPLDEISSKLHNIYYRSLSFGNSIDKKANMGNIFVDICINDARKAIKSLQPGYDFIFHDPFTPSKVPTLWTVEFFTELYRLLDINGNLTTYSNAAPVRSAMIEAGFYVGATNPIGKKTTGTIAYKNPELLKSELSVKESGIIETKAGIPYRDKYLNLSSEQIIKNRNAEQDNSNRISSSKFIKQNCRGN